jgi:hypothetical protein
LRNADAASQFGRIEQAAADSGRVAVTEGWMSRLAERHCVGPDLAVQMVFLTSMVAFRAVAPALLAMVTVVIGVRFV